MGHLSIMEMKMAETSFKDDKQTVMTLDLFGKNEQNAKVSSSKKTHKNRMNFTSDENSSVPNHPKKKKTKFMISDEKNGE